MGKHATENFVTGITNTKANQSIIDTESINQATNYVAFGDSVTEGWNATVEANEYVSLVAAGKGWSYTNLGNAGKRMNDPAIIDAMYAQTVTTNHVYTLLSGINDAKSSSNNMNLVDSFRGCLQAGIAWLTIPDAYKTRAANTTKTGTWTNNPGIYGGMNYYSGTNGSTMTATVHGTTAYIGYTRNPNDSGTFRVTIDGVSLGIFNTNHTVPTRSDNGSFSPYLLRFPNLSNGEHTVVVTVTSATATTNEVFIDWFAGNGFPKDPLGPNVYVGNCLRATDAYYTANPTHSDAAVASYNYAINDAINSLARDGLNACLVNVSDGFDRANLDTDGLHPTNAGHVTIANMFLNQMSSVVKTRDRANALSSNTPRVYPALLNGWVRFSDTLFGGIAYMKDANGFVHLSGIAKSGTINTAMFILPVGFRPGLDVSMATVAGGSFANVRVKQDGTVLPVNGSTTWYSLDNISFLAEG